MEYFVYLLICNVLIYVRFINMFISSLNRLTPCRGEEI